VNLLGETYLDLDPGDQRRPAAPGARIPRSRTGAPVELDDLLNTLDPDTRALLRILIGEAGAALGGRGSDLGALLEELPPSLDALQSLLAEVEGETRTLRALLDDGDRLLAALAPRRDDLGELVDVAGTALTATASRRRELGEAVAEAPAALRRLRGTLAELGTTAQALGPTARALREASPPLARTLDALPAFAADASGTLSAARRAAPALRRLGAGGAPVVRRLRPTAQELVRFTDVLVPVAAMLDRDGARRLLAVADYLGKVKQSSDGLGHLFRLHAILDRDLVASALERYGGDQALDFLLAP
jgi:phospholipid/cholesterol/gamma-HCH transport system substrate-binding protein